MTKSVKSKKIFVSVGTRFPMDRLVESVEAVVKKHPKLRANAQIGDSQFQSKHLKSTQWLSAYKFEQAVKECDVLVSHAGMGNILLAAEHKKQIFIMPRREELGEHIDDHQFGTAAGLSDMPFITVVGNADDLEKAILKIILDAEPLKPVQLSRQKLIASLRNFIDDDQL